MNQNSPDGTTSKIINENHGECFATIKLTQLEETESNDDTTVSVKLKAERGDAIAQFNLGSMYHAGDGVTQDDKQAVIWFKKAAEQGHGTSQLNLAIFYARHVC